MSAAPQTPVTDPTHGTVSNTQLTGGKLVVARALWILITILELGLVIVGIPQRYDKLGTSLLFDLAILTEAGVPSEVVSIYNVSIGILLFVMFSAVGIGIFLRRSDSYLVIFTSLTLILMGGNFSSFVGANFTGEAPLSQPPVALLALLASVLLLSFEFTALYWLPDGRFVPRWTIYLVGIGCIGAAVILITQPYPRSTTLLNTTIALPLTVTAIAAQIYRYRTTTNVIHRQQSKWVIVGIVIAAIGFIFWQIAYLVIPNFVGDWVVSASITARLVWTFILAAVPICVGIAVLRYGLWNVDFTLNRSLVYGGVAILLGIVFLGAAFLLQAILGREQSGIALAVSVFGAGLLFNPLCKRAQRFVDRRLYGFRFDLNQLAEAQKAQKPADITQHGYGIPNNLLTGRTLGVYQVLGMLGKGGMSEVYLGEGNGRKVAIKILPVDLAIQAAFRKRFEREAQALAALDHPNIVKVFDYGMSDNVYYMALEYVEGRELGDIIRQRSKISLEDARPFLHDFASALDYIHQHGLVHRDIKPSNIMVRLKDEMQQVVLMDFGVAKIPDVHTRLTDPGAIGTIDYMAPEQILAAKEVDHRADIYALGVVVYEMLTGERPFKGNVGQVLFAHLQQPPPDPRDLNPDIPRETAKAIMKAMAKKPEERFQTTGEFAVALG